MGSPKSGEVRSVGASLPEGGRGSRPRINREQGCLGWPGSRWKLAARFSGGVSCPAENHSKY